MHVSHCIRTLRGLPSGALEVDSFRMMVAYYSLSSLDLLSSLDTKVKADEKEDWKSWIWKQYIADEHIAGFRGSSFLTGPSASAKEPPHILMTYTALLSLAILRDDFCRLDRRRVLAFLERTQLPDGSFEPWPGSEEGGDIRIIYAALATCSMLNSWDGIDLDKAVAYVKACRVQDGSYGQTPHAEANGGATYCAVAALNLASHPLQGEERDRTVRWLVHRQRGGFQGRIEKEQDACYSFWCGAALTLLGCADFVDRDANAEFLMRCQFKLGGFAKAAGEFSDPLHTYLSMAALSIYPPSWGVPLTTIDPLLNARTETVAWIREKMN
ncbi:terpenoid cyclases/Protein prenyltransferase [Dacryopinax primogenitus]|uniref:Terpenoid cyclases/Protein prenyltransferase n=1 Tax=Dacryopinax primogenitus (strain DJM 731) TaxID=1858805 RepID=M5G2M5_DACPD|nr:terpenoid cyclases/Protein prenyltransferase [Dacryopinax primogenitus]EJU02944.1 terpenoid cyclases/Protein prenyltransferase [Dacryopinax primogenitus]